MAYMSLLLWIPSRQQFVGEIDFGGVFIDGDIKELLNEDSEEDETYEDDLSMHRITELKRIRKELKRNRFYRGPYCQN